MRGNQTTIVHPSLWGYQFKIGHVFAILLAMALVGCATQKKELKVTPQAVKWTRPDIPPQYLALLSAISASDAAGIEAAIQQGADPNRFWCPQKGYGYYGLCEPGEKGKPFLWEVLTSYNYTKSAFAIPVLKKYSQGWGRLDPSDTYGYIFLNSRRSDLTDEESTVGRKLVGKALVSAGVNITPEFIEKSAYWTKDLYCKKDAPLSLQDRSVVQSVAQDAKMTAAFNRGVTKADKECSELRKSKQAAAENEQREMMHKAQVNAKLVRQIGQKICRSVEGTLARPVAYSMGETIYDKPVPTRYYVTAFTESSANSKIQLRISSVYRMEGSRLINVETLGGKTIYKTNALVWEDPREWEPCD